jgi:hypothetical protein
MLAARSRALVLPVTLAIGAILSFTALAAAMTGPTSYSTSISMSGKFPAFHGKLHSKSNFCVADRPVRVFRERSGPDKLLGDDRSEDDGSWVVPVGDRLISGVYYTKAPPYGSASLDIVCRPALSRVAVVD